MHNCKGNHALHGMRKWWTRWRSKKLGEQIFSNARSEKQNSPYGTYIHLKQHFLNSSVVDLIRRHSTLSKIIKGELCLEGYACNKISSLSDSLSDSLRSTFDFQLGGAASVGEYKKIISVSSNELIMQIGQRKEIQSWRSSERVAKG